jgi:Xaa-Pro aminopeptidase
MARRLASVRELLRTAGARVLVVAGHATGRGELQYLSNAPVRWESLLLVPLDGDPILWLQLDNHAAGAAPWSTVPVRVAGPGLGALVGAEAARWAGPDGSVAVLGPLSERLGRGLRGALGDRPVIDLGPAFTASRLVKSDEELRWTAWGASVCDAAVATFCAEARPGMREDELGALLQGAAEAAGGQIGICFLATASMSEGGAAVPNQTWSRRRTAAGDLAVFELSAGFGGATGQVLRTVTLGGEPSPVIERLHGVADATFAALFAAVRPGATAGDLEAIGGRCIEDEGLTIIDDLVHGYGGGYLPPHVRTPGTRHGAPPDLVLREGMLLVLQPNVVTPDRRHGVQTGELVVVTAEGARSLHHAPRGLLRAVGT